MWRKTIAVGLLLVTVRAEGQGLASDSVSPQEPPRSTQRAWVTPYFQYNYLRRGTSQDVLFILNTGRPFVSVTEVSSAQPKIVPVRLELQSSQGLKYLDVAYPKGNKQKFSFASEPISVESGTEFPINFKLAAATDAPLGVQILTGKVTYQVVNDRGPVSPQQLELQIPVTVVEHQTHVDKVEWPFVRVSPGLIVLLVVLAPILIPLNIICGIFSQDCRC